jgi:hypothetical protein
MKNPNKSRKRKFKEFLKAMSKLTNQLSFFAPFLQMIFQSAAFILSNLAAFGIFDVDNLCFHLLPKKISSAMVGLVCWGFHRHNHAALDASFVFV